MNVFTTLCLGVCCPSRACLVYHDACLLSRGYISCMVVYSTVCMYAFTVHCLFLRYFPVARARMLVRRTSLRLLVIARISFMHVCVLDARYVRLDRG